jgi:hypothetical protein
MVFFSEATLRRATADFIDHYHKNALIRASVTTCPSRLVEHRRHLDQSNAVNDWADYRSSIAGAPHEDSAE